MLIRPIMLVLSLLMLSVDAIAANLPLKALPNDKDRNHWLPEQVNKPGELEALRQLMAQPAVKYRGEQDKPIQIALIYPSADSSDFWSRNYLALTKRLDDMGILYQTTEFTSRDAENELQSAYAKRVIEDADFYDYVIFGPDELVSQSENIQNLAQTETFSTYIWTSHTPLKNLEKQPALWFDFSSAYGANKICNYVLERLGNDVNYAMIRGIWGVVDSQRSGDFKQCVNSRGDWVTAFEHYGNFERNGGYLGANRVKSYNQITMIHIANTDMAMGVVESLELQGKLDEIFLTGWGGTSMELELIRRSRLNATPMRMIDDVGAATAEAIRADLEGRQDQLPMVFLGRITVAHDQMSNAELDELQKEAFRFSGSENMLR